MKTVEDEDGVRVGLGMTIKGLQKGDLFSDEIDLTQIVAVVK